MVLGGHVVRPEDVLMLQGLAGNRAIAQVLTSSGPPHVRAAPAVQRLSFLDPPQGQVPVERQDDWLKAEFDVKAEFKPSETIATKGRLPQCGEYRQLIKGQFFENGEAITQHLYGGKSLQKNEWREDGNFNNVMGHRDSPNSASHYYNDQGFTAVNDKSGLYYKGTDTPGPQSGPGKKVSFSIQFKGQLVDHEDNDRVLLESAEWAATGEWDRTGEAPVKPSETERKEAPSTREPTAEKKPEPLPTNLPTTRGADELHNYFAQDEVDLFGLSKVAKSGSDIDEAVKELEKLFEKVEEVYSRSGAENPEGLTEKEFESLRTVVTKINAWLTS